MTKLTEDYIIEKKTFTTGGFLPLPRVIYMCMIIIFKQLFSKPLGQSRPNFMWSPLGKRKCKFCLNGLTYMIKMAAMPIYDKI